MLKNNDFNKIYSVTFFNSLVNPRLCVQLWIGGITLHKTPPLYLGTLNDYVNGHRKAFGCLSVSQRGL